MVYIAEEEKPSNWSNYCTSIMDGNSTVCVATYKIMFIRDDYLTEHTGIQNTVSVTPKEFLILKKTLITTNFLCFCFIVAPCILVYVEFTHQQTHFFILQNTLKFTLKYT